MKKITPAVAYLRMSDKKQDKSIPAQRAEIERYAAAHGYQVLRWYIDEGISGAENEKRLGFQNLISDAQKLGDFTAIIVWDQDRFSRFDPMEANHYWYLLRQAGVKIVTVAKGELDFSTLGSWITASVTQHGKNEYLRDLSRNVLRGRLAKARRGKWQHNRAPYGYRIERDGDLVADEGATADVVREIFRSYADEDNSLWRIAHALNGRGVKSPSGKQWKSFSVGAILRRECYVTGKLSQFTTKPKGKFNSVVNGEIVTAGQGGEPGKGIDIACPKLIDKELWDRSQQFMVRRKSQTSSRRWNSGSVLIGLMHCAHCGAKMYAGDHARGKSADQTERTYWCSTYHHQGKAYCTRNLIHESAILDYLIQQLQEAVLNPATIAKLGESLARQLAEKQKRPAADLAGQRKRLAELDRDISAAVKELKRTPDDLYGLAVEDLRQLRKERQALNATLEATRGNGMASADDNAQAVETALAHVTRLREALKAADPKTVRHALGEMVERVDLWFDRIPGKKQMRTAFATGKVTVRDCSNLMLPTGRNSR